MLKESAYNVYKETQGEYLVYNTLYGGFARLDTDEYNKIKSLSFGLLEIETVDLLKINGFIIDSCINETEVYDKARHKIIKLQKVENTGYVIAVTTDCNARCPYCYEKGTDIIYMDRQCADKVINFIDRNYNGNIINITWFGGEPLLNIEIINYICEKLVENNIKFISSIITNGYLFNDKLVTMAGYKWNLSHVQISLDGTEPEYNKIKNYKYTNINPFKNVIKNIERLVNNEINVSIRLNISRDNAKNIQELVKYISDKILFNKYLVIYPAFVEGLEKKYSLNDNEKVDIIKELLDIVPFYSLAWYRSKLYEPPYLYACMRENPLSVVIDSDGSICRCEHYIGRKKLQNINNTYDNVKNFFDVKIDYEVNENCKKCKFYPRCLGGCMADRLEDNGHCSIDRYIIEALMQDYG